MATFVSFFLMSLLTLSCRASISERTKIMNAILDPTTYDSRVRPNEGSGPVEIKINSFISFLRSISESDKDFTIDIYLRQLWKDERLRHNSTKFIVVPPRSVDKLWYPDLFFSNEKKGELHTVTQPNRYIRITKEGEVLLSQRFTLTLGCPTMAFQKFPFDTQICPIKLESYGYSTDEVVFKWSEDKENPVQLSEDHEPPSNYEVMETNGKLIQTEDCTKTYSTGSFTCLVASLTFGRKVGYHIFNTFIPSFIITTITWLGFWISPSPPVSRITLKTLCLLSMIGLIDSAKRTTPQVSYIVAMDVWMIMSLVFIVLAILETAFASWLYHKGEVNDRNEDKVESGTRRKRSCCNWKGCAIKVDVLCRLVVPALYFGWAGFYWFVYTKFDI